MLDFQTCEDARLSRDARFDGMFFVGVTISRICCRVICPVRQLLLNNVT
jgi:AraC family transcriptional regulator of adaptative response/methylated-DNA-[protein]-cysteine methyltransferase